MTKNINGFVNGQQLSVIAECVAADSMRFLTAKFDLSSEWLEYEDVYAHFLQGESSYWIKLTDGEIRAEDHLDLGAGCWQVYLHGNVSENGEVVSRITTNIAFLTVERTGSLAGEPFPHMNPSDIEDLIAKKHWHDNKETLDKFGESSGKPTFNGEEIGGASSWDDIEDKPTDLEGFGLKNEVEETMAEVDKKTHIEIYDYTTSKSKYTAAELYQFNIDKRFFSFENLPVTPGYVTNQIFNGVFFDPVTKKVSRLTIDDRESPLKQITIVDTASLVSDSELTSGLSMKLDKSVAKTTATPQNKLITEADATAENITYDGSQTYGNGTVGKEISQLKSDIIKKLDANHGEENEGKILGIDENGDVIPANAPSPLPTPSSALNGKVLKVKDGRWDVGEDDIGLSDDDKMFSFAIDENSHLILSTTDATMQNYDFEIDSNGHLIMTYEEA